MALSTRTAWTGLVAILALLVLHLQPTSAADPISQLYCSEQNTGSDGGVVSQYEFQSQGNCKGNCSGNAFAIVLWDRCWCSNYIPEDQKDIGDCSESCPGYPDEKCGDRKAKLFGYYEMSHQPSGTQSLSQPSSTESQSSSPTTMQTSVVSDENSSAALSTSLPNTSSDSPSTPQQTTGSSVVVTTINGVVSTKVIIYTPTTTAAPSTEKNGAPVGAIAGGVVGGVLGIAAIVAGVLFLLGRRRKQKREQDEGFQTGVTRNTSTMSKSGLLKTEKTTQYPPPVATGSHRSSRMNLDNDSISPISGSDRRNSRPYLFDQRMNPGAIMSMDNTSRGSFISMDDARDYGRTLNVRNPDPDPR